MAKYYIPVWRKLNDQRYKCTAAIYNLHITLYVYLGFFFLII